MITSHGVLINESVPYIAIPTGAYFDKAKILFPVFITLWVSPTVTALSAAIATALLFRTPTIVVMNVLICCLSIYKKSVPSGIHFPSLHSSITVPLSRHSVLCHCPFGTDSPRRSPSADRRNVSVRLPLSS